MKAGQIFLIIGLVIVAYMMARISILKPRTAPEIAQTDVAHVTPPAPRVNSRPVGASATNPNSLSVERAGSSSASTPARTSANKDGPLKTPTQTAQAKEPLHDPDARVALGLVGIDAEAEAYWLEAISDSSLPDKEREDLMEDLNEEGLSDHKRPGPEDFPLIMNRLAIVEEIAPHADEFMLPHLREAYKDLLNLAEITQGRGEPVK
jgi:hypothetical protein